MVDAGIGPAKPVIVLIGGTQTLHKRLRERLEQALDRGLGAAASDKGAVIITGGTNAGIIALVGSMSARRENIHLIGVAPRSRLRLGGGPQSDEGDLVEVEPRHNDVVLTPGLSWGAETEYLFQLASLIAGPDMTGLVILANGGPISRYETQRFLSGGWPVLAITGTGREADRLAIASRPSTYRTDLMRRLPTKYSRIVRAWGRDAQDRDVEVHNVRAVPELLYRRIVWRLTDAPILKDAWVTYSSFDGAARKAKRRTRSAQSAIFLSTVALVLISLLLAYYSQGGSTTSQFLAQNVGLLHLVIVALPIAIVIAQTVADLVVPSRDWVALRQAAETSYRAILTYRARQTARDIQSRMSFLHRSRESRVALIASDSAAELMSLLARADAVLDETSVSIASLSQSRGRPEGLGFAVDEFAPLTTAEYVKARIDDQIGYFHSTARRMRRDQTLTIVGTASLAAIAAGIAAESDLTAWVPFVVFLASAISVLQQRARWRERIRLMSVAAAALRGQRRDIAVAEAAPTRRAREIRAGGDGLESLVVSTESILEREHLGWTQAVIMGSA